MRHETRRGKMLRSDAFLPCLIVVSWLKGAIFVIRCGKDICIKYMIN